jgi:hypothetical protein
MEAHMATRILIILGIVAIAVAPASAQVSTQGAIAGSSSFSGSAGFGPPHPVGPAVTGAPYSGEEVTENIKILTDGTHITQKMMGRKVWRDNEGRTRTERPLGMGPNQPSMPVIVEIIDPVAGFKYTLDTQKKIAHRQTIPSMPSRVLNGAGGGIGIGGGGGGRAGSMGAAIAAPMIAQGNAPVSPRFANEKIGTQTIDGVLVEGMRSTVTYPVGAIGNDREFSAVTERWMSPDLKVQILSKSNDPRQGENTFRIENLSRTSPDPMLFVVPSDYTTVDEAGAFTIEFRGQ